MTPADNEWMHECHNCSHTFITSIPVDDGVQYETLIEFAKFFVEPGLFEKNMGRVKIKLADFWDSNFWDEANDK